MKTERCLELESDFQDSISAIMREFGIFDNDYDESSELER
jgi:hypothetical protein